MFLTCIGCVKENFRTSPSLGKTICQIVFFSLFLWGAIFFTWRWHSRQLQLRAEDPRWTIKRIAARPLTYDRLPIAVLSELLDLQESSRSLFSVQPKELASQLIKCPSIATARVWRLLPGTLGVEYALKSPVAKVSGVKNVALDIEGRVFFLFPFFSPKRLPSIVLPLSSFESLADLQESVVGAPETSIALEILAKVSPVAQSHNFTIESVDLAHYAHTNIFRREVVMCLLPKNVAPAEERHLYVRLSPKRLFSSLKELSRILASGFCSGTLDLRYDHFAIVVGDAAPVANSGGA